MQVKIESDGTAHGTKVTDANGTEIEGVSRIEFEPLVGGGVLSGRLHILPKLDVKAEVTITRWNSNMDAAPWDKVVMLRGDSGYHKPHEVFVINGYRQRVWHGGGWNDMTGTELNDSGWKPSAWRPCEEGER